MSDIHTLVLISAAFGVLAGEIADFVFDRANDSARANDKEKDVENQISYFPQSEALLHWFEHYHWGMILLGLYSFGGTYFPECSTLICTAFRRLTDSPFLIGFGLSLILDENRSDTRFAWEKNPGPWYHFYESSILGIGIGLIVICRWLALALHWLVVAVVVVIVSLYILLHERTGAPLKTAFPRATQQDAFEDKRR
jgi:hypothetical protein